MKCIILAAGYATRLHPLTVDRPKPLLKIGEKPIMEYILDRVAGIPEIESVYIVTNSRFFPAFIEWKKSYQSGKPIDVLDDRTTSDSDKLGSVGDIAFVIGEKAVDEDLLVIAGDNLFEFDISGMVSYYKAKNSCVVALYNVGSADEARKMGVVELDDENRIVGFEEKPQNPKSTLISTACYIFQRRILDEIRNSHRVDRLGDFVAGLSKKYDVYGYHIAGRWFDIGSFEQLKQAEGEFSK